MEKLEKSVNKITVQTELPIYWADFSSNLSEIELAFKGIEDLRAQYPSSTESNVKSAYMSPWKSHLLTNKFDNLIHLIKQEMFLTIKSDLNIDIYDLRLDLVLTDFWAAIYDRDDKTLIHNHIPADFAAVIYLEAGPNCAPIVFENSIAVKPENGLLIFFPGWVNHHVPENFDKRTILAMNFIISPGKLELHT